MMRNYAITKQNNGWETVIMDNSPRTFLSRIGDARRAFGDGYKSLGETFGNSRRMGETRGMRNISDIREAYQNTTLCSQIVNIPIKDMLRNGRRWNVDDEAEIESILAVEQLVRWNEIFEAGLISRALFGGCAIYIGVDGAGESHEELVPENVGQGTLKFLRVIPKGLFGALQYDRRIGSPTHGEPIAYPLRQTANVMRGREVKPIEPIKMIHRSRLVIIPGERQPDPSGSVNEKTFWGVSTLQSRLEAIERVIEADQHSLALLQKFRTNVLGITGLSNALKNDPNIESSIGKSMAAIADFADNYNILAIDSAYKFEQHSTGVAGITDMIDRFRTAVAGAAQIPATKLYGMSPAGQNATGVSDRDNYFNRIEGDQINLITNPSVILDQVIARSAIGAKAEGVGYAWNPLNNVSRLDRLKEFSLHSQAIANLHTNQLLPTERATDLTELLLNELDL